MKNEQKSEPMGAITITEPIATSDKLLVDCVVFFTVPGEAKHFSFFVKYAPESVVRDFAPVLPEGTQIQFYKPWAGDFKAPRYSVDFRGCHPHLRRLYLLSIPTESDEYSGTVERFASLIKWAGQRTRAIINATSVDGERREG